ncbi:GntR family transcriptional regulator [Prauserella cavernicola]|uniref:GntR family transcriptional regulator n=1 Tax=Prauserella cavernicola TaxID=2800127 RepID=A0A934QU66_9PSEU|nr:GntR family transcriptional regulator [Prauserella cavernicola]MBK1786666.1 GntR family transcriptional regulator [Prauserella cavernicola]
MTSAARATNSSNVIADRLRTSIRDGGLLPGTRLVQEKLAAELDVSRIPLREALHTLAAEGLIEVLPQRGMHVAELSRADIEDLFELRLQLEPQLADEIVRGCRERDVEALRSLAEQMRDKGADAAGRATLNYEFHRRIYELADRRLSLRFIDQLLHLVEPYSRRWVRSGHELTRIDDEHAAMVEALRTHDAELLRRVIVAHVEGARDHVLARHPG